MTMLANKNGIRSPYRHCILCPRNCGVDRTAGKKGYCGMTSVMMAARAAIHHWEEPCISGKPDEGAGAVFFSGCCLRCVFCQNAEISRQGFGLPVTSERLTEIFFELREKNACCIDLVTADIWLPTVVPAVLAAKKRGIGIPFFLNTGSYINVETLRHLEGVMDGYLPDLKYISGKRAGRYSGAADYPEAAKAAIDEMVRQQGEIIMDAAGRLWHGVLIRHLLLPGGLLEAKAVVKYLHQRYQDRVILSLLNQYTPVPGLEAYPELKSHIRPAAYDEWVDYAAEIGVIRGYMQEAGSASGDFIPIFDGTGIRRERKEAEHGTGGEKKGK